jgi:protein disulfide-isomerase A1
MKLLVVSALAFIFAVFADNSEVILNNGVYSLDRNTYSDFLDKNEFVMVKFYAPWCGHCKNLAPIYEKVALKFTQNNPQVKFAKFDATAEDASKLLSPLDIKGYPTLYWFKSKKPILYDGGRSEDEISNWVTKKSGPSVSPISTYADLKDKLAAHKVVVLGTFDKIEGNSNFEVFSDLAYHINGVEFYYSTSHEIFKEVGSNKVVMFRQFDEPKLVFEDEFNYNNLENFITSNKNPLVIELGPETHKFIFGDPKKKVVLLFSLLSGLDKNIVGCYKDAAKKYKEKAVLALVDSNIENNANIISFFGLKKDDEAVAILDIEKDLRKYRLKGDMTCPAIEGFLQNYFEDKLTPFYMSEEVPADWNEKDVYTLVGKNFKEVVSNSNKAVFVKFYAPWCGHCKALAPTWEKLGASYKNNANVVIAKIDATKNEVEGITIEGFPQLKLFLPGEKESIAYEGQRDIASLKNFLESHVPGLLEKSQKDEL